MSEPTAVAVLGVLNEHAARSGTNGDIACKCGRLFATPYAHRCHVAIEVENSSRWSAVDVDEINPRPFRGDA